MDTVTPGEFKQHGKELEIRYAFHDTPFGECLVAETTRGICFLGFVNHDNRDEVLEDLRARWAEASLVADSSTARSRIHQIFSQKDRSRHESVRLFLKGTNFQLKVWEALLKIPEGTIVSYGGLATALGNPQANRAVGAAVGQNPVAFLIPCHRVLRSSGDIGGYHWGTPRKKAMLAMEAARR